MGSSGFPQRNPSPAGLPHSINFIAPPFTSEMGQHLSSVGSPGGAVPISCKGFVKPFDVVNNCIRGERAEFNRTLGIVGDRSAVGRPGRIQVVSSTVGYSCLFAAPEI